ncbi:NAD(P)-dependent dehydrogenase (short-subunit alcohol dehydrogenase family) [Salinibacter ruber]|nr:NAD(P)-dependent dehydrogenase (short-subunit alcohol dehydrogenase family) [Salinibacter ruber]
MEVFKKEGWQVIGVDRKSSDQEMSDHFIEADVSREKQVSQLFQEVGSKIERLHALVNCVGVQTCKPVVEMEAEEWDETMAANLRSVFLMVKNAHDLLSPGGAIVNVGSVHSEATSSEIAAYAASKGGVVAFTRALSIEFAGDGIRVNAVLPGAVDTEMLRDGLQRDHAEGGSIQDKVRSLGNRHVIGRIGRPEEIGEVIVFLADDDRSSFVTGHALTADGGATARLSTE